MKISVVSIILFALISVANSQFETVHDCSDIFTYPPNSTYASNLRALLTTLSNSTTSHFNRASTKTKERIQALYQCRSDISPQQCASCVSNAATAVLKQCPIEKTAVIWADKCLLRFSNETIFSKLTEYPTRFMVAADNVLDDEKDIFTGFVRSDLNDCATEAADSPSKFAVRERDTNLSFSITPRIYYLVQCTADLSNDDCRRCLQDQLKQYPSCCSSAVGARGFNPSCNFRFENYHFFIDGGIDSVALNPPPSPSDSSNPPPSPSDSSNPPSPSPSDSSNPPSPSPSDSSYGPSPSPSLFFNGAEEPSPEKSALSTFAIIAISTSTGLFVLTFSIGCFVFIRQRGRPNQDICPMREESLVFHLRTLIAATNNFSSQNLIGHGGYGEVYKGTLENGNEIAVKRLGENSFQGDTEFKSEVSLVANLQHRNLTRLIGFCLEGEERILVYEYLYNKSLDFFLFEKESERSLNWAQRYKIIEGIARGILYLHEDSRLKIIHRDLKASNILLDGYLNPKISDFGTARICGVDETRVMTHRVIGTRCYMAPEYAIHGTFSVKSDVYSFGILMLEIITGFKATQSPVNNNVYSDLIDFVWKHWIEETVTEVVDKGMEQSYSEKEVLRCVHVALLCVEQSPSDRPTMATVVLMLNMESANVKLPKQPFITHNNNSMSSES